MDSPTAWAFIAEQSYRAMFRGILGGFGIRPYIPL